MGMLDYLKIAKEYSLKKWNFDIIKDAGVADGWHYFSCTRLGRPRWSSLPCAIRISSDGIVEELEDFESRRRVSSMASA